MRTVKRLTDWSVALCFRLTESRQKKFSGYVITVWTMPRKKQRQSYLHHGLLRNALTILWLGIVENKTLTIHVEIHSDLSIFVSVSEIPAFHWNKNLECLHLKTFLPDLASRQLCLGVTDSPLQEYANLPTNQTVWTSIFCTPCISSNCWVLLQSYG